MRSTSRPSATDPPAQLGNRDVRRPGEQRRQPAGHLAHHALRPACGVHRPRRRPRRRPRSRRTPTRRRPRSRRRRPRRRPRIPTPTPTQTSESPTPTPTQTSESPTPTPTQTSESPTPTAPTRQTSRPSPDADPDPDLGVSDPGRLRLGGPVGVRLGHAVGVRLGHAVDVRDAGRERQRHPLVHPAGHDADRPGSRTAAAHRRGLGIDTVRGRCGAAGGDRTDGARRVPPAAGHAPPLTRLIGPPRAHGGGPMAFRYVREDRGARAGQAQRSVQRTPSSASSARSVGSESPTTFEGSPSMPSTNGAPRPSRVKAPATASGSPVATYAASSVGSGRRTGPSCAPPARHGVPSGGR